MSVAPDLGQLQDLFLALPALLPEQRWFADKQRIPAGLRPAATFWLRRELPALALALVDVDFERGPSARYQLWIAVRELADDLADVPAGLKVVVSRPDSGLEYRAYDALADPAMGRYLIAWLRAGAPVISESGAELRVRALSGELPDLDDDFSIHPLSVQQSNSSVVFGEQLLLKVFRRIWSGVNPELELLEALAQAGFVAIAKPWIALEATVGAESYSLGMLQTFLRNGTDGFTLALTSLRDLHGDLLPEADGTVPTPEQCAAAVLEQGGSFLASADQIGQLTAEMHRALASPAGRESLAARELRADDIIRSAERIGKHLDEILLNDTPELEPLRVHRQGVRALLERLEHGRPSGMAIRVHGDYHLGQLLRTDAGWHVLDFEGRPAEPIAARRARATPLRDVAGMLRSFDYAAAVALRQQAHPDAATAGTLAPYGRAWARLMRERFLARYLDAVAGAAMVPDDPDDLRLLLSALELGQALYEVEYELRTRPEWLSIPLEGIARLLQQANP
ncbi:MAG: maltokinase N-terminal cap-like domain-containing protein [Candidatus Dormibacteria bacterium]